MKDIKKILAPFNLSIGKQQDVANLLKHLKKHEVTTEEVIEYVENLKIEGRKHRKEREAQLIASSKRLQPCPECNSIMKIFPVNDKPNTQTGDPTDKSVWLCGNKECMHVIYNKAPIKEITKAGGL